MKFTIEEIKFLIVKIDVEIQTYTEDIQICEWKDHLRWMQCLSKTIEELENLENDVYDYDNSFSK